MNGMQLGFLRIFLAGLVLVPVALRHMRGLSRSTWLALAINGFVGSLVPAILFAWAQMRLPSAVAGMLNALSPLWTLVLAVGLYGTVVRKKQVLGLLLGFVGALGLMSLKDAAGAVHWGSAGLLVVATACYGLSINVGAQPAVRPSRRGHQRPGPFHDRLARGCGFRPDGRVDGDGASSRGT